MNAQAVDTFTEAVVDQPRIHYGRFNDQEWDAYVAANPQIERCVKSNLFTSTYEATVGDIVVYSYNKYHYNDGCDNLRNST